MKKILALTALSAGLFTAGFSQAQQSAELKVTGTITPAACTPVIGSLGVYNYGNIDLATLSNTDVTILEAKTLTLTVTCDAPAKLAINVTDNRTGSAPAATVGGQGFDFGLGAENLGSYTVALTNVVEDANQLDVLTETATDTWLKDGTGFKADGTQRKGFAASGETTPDAHKVITGDLTVTPTINKLSDVQIGDGISLDGSATLEVSYI